MDMVADKKYLRIENVVYVEMLEGETVEDAEDRFLCALPDGMDVANFRSEIADLNE